MADNQPWRNPRPAPGLPEMQSRWRQTPEWSWLRAWWPALVWAAVIFTLSTDPFSEKNTAWILEPLLRKIMPWMNKQTFHTIHFFIRKSAHFTEYFVFAMLIYRAARRGQAGWRWTWGVAALFVAGGYAVLDEVHQAFVASRTASAYDSLLDSIGAFVSMAVLWLWFRLRRTTIPPASTSLDTA